MSNSKPSDFEQLAKWQQMWDQASSKFETEPARPLKPEPEEEISDIDLIREHQGKSIKLDNRTIYRLAQNIDKVFKKDVVEEGFTDSHKVARNLDKDYMTNPTHFASVGKDQKLRVTPNFTDGPFLRELSDLKIQIEALEREVHTAAVSDRGKLENKLRAQVDSIRNRIEELSDIISAPHPIEDVS